MQCFKIFSLNTFHPSFVTCFDFDYHINFVQVSGNNGSCSAISRFKRQTYNPTITHSWSRVQEGDRRTPQITQKLYWYVFVYSIYKTQMSSCKMGKILYYFPTFWSYDSFLNISRLLTLSYTLLKWGLKLNLLLIIINHNDNDDSNLLPIIKK